MPEVVVPLDGSPRSESVLPFALALARGTPMTLVTTQWDGEASAAHEYLRERARAEGATDVETVVELDQEPAAGILATAARHPGAVICMATHGRGGLAESVLGSVAEAVVREAESPVLLVGPDVAAGPGPGTTMLVALDTAASAHHVVGPAVAIAGSLGLTVTAVHVAMSPPVPIASDADFPSFADDEDVLDAATAAFASAGVEGATELVRGTDPAHEIVVLARSHDAAAVAVGTHARRGLGRLALGNTAMRVVRHCPCPVLVVRA